MRNNLKLTKKIFKLIILSLLMCITGIVNVSAEEMEETKVIIENANAVIGHEVEVVVGVSNGSGIGAYELDIAYDNNALEFVKGESIIQTLAWDVNDNGSSTYISGVLSTDIQNNAYIPIIKLTYKVKEATLEGAYLLYVAEGIMVSGQTGEGIFFDVCDGEVCVNEKLIGDVDNDSKINIADAMMVFRYVAGKDVKDKTIIENNGDVNGDGIINIIDAMMMFHYVSDRIGAFIQSNTNNTNNDIVAGENESIQIEEDVEITQNELITNDEDVEITQNELITNDEDDNDFDDETVSKQETTEEKVSVNRPQQSLEEEITTNKNETDEKDEADDKDEVDDKDEAERNTDNTIEKETIKNEKPGSYNDSTIAVTGINLNKTEVSLNKGAMIALKATVKPTNANNKSVKWSSSDVSVATVSSNGRVTAVGNGTAIITVITNDGGYTETCKVNVVTSVTLVELDKTKVTLNMGDSVTLAAIVKPEIASNKKVTWSSSNIAIATVDNNGKVTAKGNGTATITVKTADGAKTASCTVKVVTPVMGVKLNISSISMNIRNTRTLIATVSPSTASNKTVTWSSSNPLVATVDNNGKVTAVKYGTANIIAKTEDGGITAVCLVRVVAPKTAVTGVSLNKTSVELKKDTTETLIATINPTAASDKSVTWSSSNTSVATVDNNGKVTAKGNGTATITVKTTDGAKTASCTVKVVTPVMGVKLNISSISMNIKNTRTLIATVSPSTASNKTITWSSSNPLVATVDNNGKVTALKYGTANIIAKTEDGGITAVCLVRVVAPKTAVTGVSLNKTSVELKKGATTTLTATINPTAASNKTVTWSSSNTAVATVDSNGKVTAKGNGTAIITVKTADGAKTATCKVTVTTSVTGVSITNKKDVAIDCNSSSNKYYQCAISVSPSTASNKAVTWSSSDSSIATVDANGKITAKTIGTATITVKTADGSKTDSIKVYVYKSNAVTPKTGNIWYRVSIGSVYNRIMEVENAITSNGSKVQLAASTGAYSQLWQFGDRKSKYGGIAIIPKCNSGSFVLNVTRTGGTLKENNLINLWTIGVDNETSMWELVRTWDGGYIFRLVNTNWVAGVTSTSVGAQLMLRKFDVFDMNQRWYLEAVDVSSGSTKPSGFETKLQTFINTDGNGENALHGDGNTYTAGPGDPNTSADDDYAAVYTINNKSVGYQCFGFANLISYNVLGSYPCTLSDATNIRSGWKLIRATAGNSYVDAIKVGDVIRYSNGGWDHSIFVTDIVGNTIYYADCNGFGDERVHYNRTILKSTLSSYLVNLLNDGSGYRGWIAHYEN